MRRHGGAWRDVSGLRDVPAMFHYFRAARNAPPFPERLEAMTYRERRQRRADTLRRWADRRAARSTAAFKTAATIADGIPFGQPILVGHHSERRHRRDCERIRAGMDRGVEHANMARSMDSRADEIERQADAAIYSDDPDAIEQLREKINLLERERERIKAVNAGCRKHGLDAFAALPATVDYSEEIAELRTLARITPWHDVCRKGFPAYKLSNLAGNITRARRRLDVMSGGARPATAAPDGHQETSTAATATERAGLTVTAGMTTPSRPGKAPRPVWTVSGDLATWRQFLIKIGGSWYRGAFLFWSDPAAEIEAACLDVETWRAEHVAAGVAAP